MKKQQGLQAQEQQRKSLSKKISYIPEEELNQSTTFKQIKQNYEEDMLSANSIRGSKTPAPVRGSQYGQYINVPMEEQSLVQQQHVGMSYENDA